MFPHVGASSYARSIVPLIMSALLRRFDILCLPVEFASHHQQGSSYAFIARALGQLAAMFSVVTQFTRFLIHKFRTRQMARKFRLSCEMSEMCRICY
jgi:hypothetical protein